MRKKTRPERRRPVKQISADGKLIATFDTIAEASEKTGASSSSICHCCRGKLKKAKGFIWEYDNSKLKLKTDPLDKFLDFL
tara:strand:+ start:657 stop:899 length:243 start_codon:yes stop_codon:yes gene_type:complete